MIEPDRMLLIALPGGRELAADLGGRLGVPVSELFAHTFPDGETLVRLDAEVKDRTVVFVGSLHHPNGKALSLVFAADAARELGAARVGLVAPYLAYMRQDHRFHPGEAITSRSFAKVLSSCLDFLLTVDPHLHRWDRLEQIYTCRTGIVRAAPAIARWLQANVPSPLIVGPDEESGQWVQEVARIAGAPWTTMVKTRRGDRDVSVELKDPQAAPGHQPVLVDDIVSSGRTMVVAAGALRDAGLPPPVCIGVHALFSDDAMPALRAVGVQRVVTCDTVAHATNGIALGEWIAPALVELMA